VFHLGRDRLASARRAGPCSGALYLRGHQWFITAPSGRCRVGHCVLSSCSSCPAASVAVGAVARHRGALITRNSVAPEQVAAGGPGTTPTTSPRLQRRPNERGGGDAGGGATAFTRPQRHSPHPKTWLARCAVASRPYPLIVLFGLNAVDELDRTAVRHSAADIRDHFTSTTPRCSAWSRSSRSLALALQFARSPAGTPDVEAGAIGHPPAALIWGLFSGMTGLAAASSCSASPAVAARSRRPVIDPTPQLAHRRLLPRSSRATGSTAPTARPTRSGLPSGR